MCDALVTSAYPPAWGETAFQEASIERVDSNYASISLQIDSRVSSDGSFSLDSEPSLSPLDDCATFDECSDMYDRHLTGPPFPEAYHATPEYGLRWSLATIRARLVSLQPQVSIPGQALEGALALAVATRLRSPLGVAACLWLSVKLLSVRTQSPCRALMASAAGVAGEDLSAAELHVASSLGWDLIHVIRSSGVPV